MWLDIKNEIDICIVLYLEHFEAAPNCMLRNLEIFN